MAKRSPNLGVLEPSLLGFIPGPTPNLPGPWVGKVLDSQAGAILILFLCARELPLLTIPPILEF